jgi:hypothetical protein
MTTIPAALRERLGPEATGGLLQLLETSHREWRADVMVSCTERFERRLAEEVAGLRVQIAQTEAVLRRDIAEMGADIRQEMAQMGADIRQDIAQMGADIRQEMAQTGAGIRQEMAQMGGGIHEQIAAARVDTVKWCFFFWIGQVVTIAGVLGVMLRLIR